MTVSAELRLERENKCQQIGDLRSKWLCESRSLTIDEQMRFDRLVAAVSDLDSRIKAAEAAPARRRAEQEQARAAAIRAAARGTQRV